MEREVWAVWGFSLLKWCVLRGFSVASFVSRNIFVDLLAVFVSFVVVAGIKSPVSMAVSNGLRGMTVMLLKLILKL
jgi:hypothetical protein